MEEFKDDKPFQKSEESNSETESKETEPKEIEGLEKEVTELDQAEAMSLLSKLKDNKWVQAVIKEINDPLNPEALSQVIFRPITKALREKMREKIGRITDKKKKDKE